MDLQELMAEINNLVEERKWGQFHSVENLIKSISIESAELLECVQWGPDFDFSAVQAELADVFTYCLMLANKLGVDPVGITAQKLESTRLKYPIEKANGRATKYDRL